MKNYIIVQGIDQNKFLQLILHAIKLTYNKSSFKNHIIKIIVKK